jgi:hypothetical protein
MQQVCKIKFDLPRAETCERATLANTCWSPALHASNGHSCAQSRCFLLVLSISRLPSEEDALPPLPLLLCKYSQTLYDSVLDTCPNRECSAEERIDRILFRALCLLNCYGREKGIHLSSGHINSVFQLWSSSSAMWHFVTTKEPDP